MIRWMLQITVMAIDIGLVVIAYLILRDFPWWFSIPFIYMMYVAWKNQGGAIAWTHRKEFMENAKRLGL